MKLPQTLHGQSPLTFHTRMFETFSLSFEKERDAIDVFESVKELTVCSELSSPSTRIVLIATSFSLRQPAICVLLHA